LPLLLLVVVPLLVLVLVVIANALARVPVFFADLDQPTVTIPHKSKAHTATSMMCSCGTPVCRDFTSMA